MRVLTPTKPSQNSMHNATNSSRKLIAAEMARAAELCNNRRGGCDWREIFEEMEFTAAYGHFIAITATAASEHDQGRNVTSDSETLLAAFPALNRS